MKNMERFAPLVIASILQLSAEAQEFAYASTNGSVTITKYIGPKTDVVIPNAIGGLPVIAIGDSAFENRADLQSVVIGNEVSNIGANAFDGCSGLPNVTLPDTLTNVAELAFQFCTSLTNVVVPKAVASLGLQAFCCCFGLTNIALPASLLSLGDFAFYNCTNLPSIVIPGNATNIGIGVFSECTSLVAIGVDTLNPTYSSVDGILFNKAQTELIRYPPAKAGRYWIPSGVTIAPLAFDSYSGLTGVLTPRFATNSGFGFTISWPTNGPPVVIEATPNLIPPITWSPISTNTLFTGSTYFSDLQWTNYPGRFYRIR
jgi:hypothetical protein